jgi:hypothetical protein
VAAVLSPSAAHAGAWAEDDQLIVGAAMGTERREAVYEADLYWERAIAPRWGLVGQLYGAGGPAYRDTWNGEALIASKWNLAQGKSGALSVQAGPYYSRQTQSGCAIWGGETRVLAGRNFGPAFAEIQTAYRLQGPACAHGRLDTTLGWRPAPSLLTMAQVFADRDFRNEDNVKAQFSAVRFVAARLGLQMGVRMRVDGAAREPALVLGLWKTD